MAAAAAHRQAQVFRVLSHPDRIALIAMLGRREACVCHLARALGRTEPYVSQHLAVLREAGLLSRRRQRAFTYYALRDFSVLGILDLAAHLTGSSLQGVSAPDGCDCPACRPTARGKRDAH